MPRFFFDIIDAGKFARDDFGDEMDDVREARDQAISLLPDVAKNELPDGEIHDFVCEVRSEADRIIYRAKLMLRAEEVDERARPSV